MHFVFYNDDFITNRQDYNTKAAFAGGRLWSRSPAQELWAKPILKSEAGVVVFNRGGYVIGTTPEGSDPPPAHCSDPESTMGKCSGCYVTDDRPWLSPCDDNVTASTGTQTIRFEFADLPAEWLGLAASLDDGRKMLESGGRSIGAAAGAGVSCEVFDIFDTAVAGKSLGTFKGGWSAMIPPHGVRFLRVGNCTA